MVVPQKPVGLFHGNSHENGGELGVALAIRTPPIFIIQAGGMMLKSQGANQEVMQPAMRYLCLAYAKTLFNANSCSITCSHVYQII